MQGLQLPLGVQLSDTASFDSYYAGPNDEALAALKGLLTAASPPLLWLFGPRGCGKTHLLQALTRRAASVGDGNIVSRTGAERGGNAACAYVPLRELSVDALEGLEQADVVCLDDVDAVLNDARWPLALLRWLDQLRAHGGRCALSASAPPERLAYTAGLALPDLKTRFSAAAIFGLKPLTDDNRGQFLRERAWARGLELPEEAARYLLVRLP
ncbi:MAG: hypothetical protein HYZ32_04475, partial [Hydrocarboniphaga effusa]|nr:hypothetical protein [Hydrocarboniphaga effusa]